MKILEALTELSNKFGKQGLNGSFEISLIKKDYLKLIVELHNTTRSVPSGNFEDSGTVKINGMSGQIVVKCINR